MSKVMQLTFTHFKEQPCGVVWCGVLPFTFHRAWGPMMPTLLCTTRECGTCSTKRTGPTGRI